MHLTLGLNAILAYQQYLDNWETQSFKSQTVHLILIQICGSFGNVILSNSLSLNLISISFMCQ